MAPTPILGGNGVPPIRRMEVPPSRSDATSSGRRERCWSRLSLAAMSSGEPTDTMMPPTCSESTQPQPGERGVVERRVGARDPGHHQLGDLVANGERGDSVRSNAAAAGRGGKRRRSGRAGRRGRTRRHRAVSPRTRGAWRAQIVRPVRAWVWSLGCAARRRRGSTSAAPGRSARASRCCSPTASHLVRDRRVGLVTNQAGVDADGVSDVARLRGPGSGWWRSSARSTDSAARPIPAPRLRRRSIRLLGYQSTASTAGRPPPPPRCSRAST